MKKAITAVVLLLSVYVAPIASAAQIDDAAAAYHERDYSTALKLITPLAQKGNASAQFSLGSMYQFGEGVPQNYTEAVKWYRLAEKKGHSGAQFNLGCLYYIGQGVPQNYAEAAKLFRLAAQKSHASAQNNLGVAYFNGQGVPQNFVKAHMWINLAASHATGDDNKKYSDAREEVAAKMTSAQIAEAQALAAKCQASNFKQCD